MIAQRNTWSTGTLTTEGGEPVYHPLLRNVTTVTRGTHAHSNAAGAVLLLSVPTLWASDFLTEGVDAARTGWVKDEKSSTPRMSAA
jgi:hypothetical protein